MKFVAAAIATMLLVLAASGGALEVRRTWHEKGREKLIQKYIHAGIVCGAAGFLAILLIQPRSPSLGLVLGVAGIGGLAGFFLAAERLERTRSND